MNLRSPINRRTFLGKGRKMLATLLGITGFAGLYLFSERFWLDVKEIELSLPRLPDEFSGMRLVHISDIHYGHYYDESNLMSVVRKIEKLKPDLICFTGDLIDRHARTIDSNPESILSLLDAPLGKYAVLGNHDYSIGQEHIQGMLEKSGFQVLKNSHQPLKYKGSTIYLAGIDDMLMSTPDIEQAMMRIPDQSLTILLAHEPDMADYASRYPVGLQLSGHSHGGQIRLPLIGDILKVDGAQNYVMGLYRFQRTDMALYVNRGIGTTVMPLRLFCRPEITVMSLKPST